MVYKFHLSTITMNGKGVGPENQILSDKTNKCKCISNNTVKMFQVSRREELCVQVCDVEPEWKMQFVTVFY